MKMKIEQLETTAKEIVEERGSHTPQMFVETKYGVEMYVLMFDGDENKEKMFDTMRKMISVRKIDKYFVAFDAWMSMYKDPLARQVRPKDDPDRKEVLIVAEFKRDNTGITVYLPFSRDGKKIIWGKRFTDEKTGTLKSHSRWNFFLEDASSEVMAMSRLQAFKKEIPDFEKELIKFVEENFDKLPTKGMTKEEAKEKIVEVAKKMIKEGRIVKSDKDE